MSEAPAVTLRLTPHNRSAAGALLAVLEAELPGLEVRLARGVEQVPAGLALYSFMSCHAAEAGRELAWLRGRHGPRLRAVAGGAHPGAAPGETLALGFDWVGVGEAGPGLAALVRAVVEGRPPAPGILPAGVAGAAGRLPLDHYEPWPRSGRLFCKLEISRGCRHRCGFCQVPVLHGRAQRHRSLEAIARALEHAAATGHRLTRFVSPNAFAYGSVDGRRPNVAAVEHLIARARASGIEEIYLGSFPSEVRPEWATDELLALVRERCANRSIVVGLQSGSEATLARLHRGHTVEQGVRAVERIARAGLRPRVDFIFGLPDETDEDRALTRRLIRHLADEQGASINTHQFVPLPGTPLAGAPAGRVDDETLALLEHLVGRRQCTDIKQVKGPLRR